MELSEFKRILRQVFLLPVLALLLLAGVLFWQIHNSTETVALIEQSDQRIALATLIERLVVDEESGLRGYQATSDPRLLEPYYQADAPMQEAIAQMLAMLQPDEPGTEIKAFAAEHRTWHEAFALPLIATIGAGGSTNDVDLNITGKVRMDSMRAHLHAIVASAEQRRIERIAKWHRQVHDMYLALAAMALVVGIGVGLFTRDRLQGVSAAFLKSLNDQHRRADELFQSEQHLRTTLASIGDGVVTCDPEGRVETMNLVAQELTGWMEAEARGRPLEAIFRAVNESTHEPVENPVSKVRRLDRIVGMAGHTLLIRKDGSVINIDDSGAPIRDQSGRMTGIVMVFRDITHERKTQSALVASEKLAVAGRLAATIAHEIHNPLDSVSNLLFLLQSGSSQEESREYLDMAQCELARVTQISRAMLSLYRESKAPVPVNLKEMLDGLLLLMQRRFSDEGIAIDSDLPADITVDGFPAELRQVFTNLIANAAEAVGRGGHLTLRVLPRPAAVAPSGAKIEAGATVEITDDGPGIAPEIREHLFQPFFTTKGEKGTGLGLWVCQGIIRKHAGTIEIKSPVDGTGRGTTVSVFLATKPTINPGGD